MNHGWFLEAQITRELFCKLMIAFFPPNVGATLIRCISGKYIVLKLYRCTPLHSMLPFIQQWCKAGNTENIPRWLCLVCLREHFS